MQMQNYPSCFTTNYYVVLEGDTLQSIAKYFGVTITALMNVNLGIGEEIFTNQILCIPVAPSPVQIEVDAKLKRLTVSKNGSKYKSYPVVIVDVPLGTFTVIKKELDVESGLGARILSLSIPDLYIRSQAVIPTFTGRRSVILNNVDAAELFNMTPVGTAVLTI